MAEKGAESGKDGGLLAPMGGQAARRRCPWPHREGASPQQASLSRRATHWSRRYCRSRSCGRRRGRRACVRMRPNGIEPRDSQSRDAARPRRALSNRRKTTSTHPRDTCGTTSSGQRSCRRGVRQRRSEAGGPRAARRSKGVFLDFECKRLRLDGPGRGRDRSGRDRQARPLARRPLLRPRRPAGLRRSQGLEEPVKLDLAVVVEAERGGEQRLEARPRRRPLRRRAGAFPRRRADRGLTRSRRYRHSPRPRPWRGDRPPSGAAASS